jgi:hypothetical protein
VPGPRIFKIKTGVRFDANIDPSAGERRTCTEKETLTIPSPATARIRRSFTDRKQRTIEQVDRLANEREQWIVRHRFYYDEDWLYMQFLVPEGKRVLDLGCGTDELLDPLEPPLCVLTGAGFCFFATIAQEAGMIHESDLEKS